VSILMRRCFGMAGALHGPKGGDRLNHRFAWPSARWGSIPIEGGVMAAHKAEIEAAPDPAARRAELEAHYLDLTSPFRTAEKFGVLEIIDPRETRPRAVRLGRGRDAGRAHQRVHQEVRQRLQVAGHHLQHVVGITGHGVALLDLRQVTHQGLEGAQFADVATLHRHIDEGHDVQAQAGRGQPGFVARDQPGFLQPTVAPVALRRRQVGGRRQLQCRGARMALQVVQNAAIDGIEQEFRHFCLADQAVGAILLHDLGQALRWVANTLRPRLPTMRS
jgi:hypothetical protein